MAKAELRRVRGGRVPWQRVIIQWAQVGDLEGALRVARNQSRRNPDHMLLAAADACRFHGDFKRAISFYDQLLKLKKGGRGLKGNKTRARNYLDCLRGMENFDVKNVRDGAFKGSCRGFRATVSVSVSVRGGKITDARVTNHRDDWCGRSMTDIPGKIVELNGLKGVDVVSRATISSNAVIYAAAAALKSGLKPGPSGGTEIGKGGFVPTRKK